MSCSHLNQEMYSLSDLIMILDMFHCLLSKVRYVLYSHELKLIRHVSIQNLRIIHLTKYLLIACIEIWWHVDLHIH